MKQKRNYLKSGLLVTLLATSGFASEGVQPVEASADSSSFNYLASRVNSIMAKAGVAFGGEFKSRGLASSVDGTIFKTGDLVEETTGKQREDVMFTSLDLEMKVAPHSALQGHAIIRLHQDWRNMFGSYTTPLSSRWLSVDGNANNIFFYNVGDYKTKYSELTLWTPEPEIMFEPYIFARQRKDVMNEVFAGDNNRVLQGANLAFQAQMKPAFNEFSAKGYFTRLKRVGKSEGSPRPTSIDADGVAMDRYSAGADIFMGFRKDAEFALSGLYTGDALNTYNAGKIEDGYALRDQILVIGGRGAFGTGLFAGIDTNKLHVRLDLEGAVSSYRTGEFVDTLNKVVYNNQPGIASNANLGTKVGIGEAGSVTLNLGAVFNDKYFVNEMAQSPVFYNARILNNAVGENRVQNSFDGLYKSVYKYTPGQEEFNTKEPVNKIAWTRGVVSKRDLDALVAEKPGTRPTNDEKTLDRTFSPIMHFGQATANRLGAQTGLNAEFLDQAILFNSEFNLYTTPTVDSTHSESLTKFDYLQYAAGLSLNIAKFGDVLTYPLVLSGSYKHSESKAKTPTDFYDEKVTVNFINMGLYWKFWKRAALMGGAQIISSIAENDVEENSKKMIKYTLVESQFAGGLEYKVTDGGTLTGTVTRIVTDNVGIEANNDADYRDESPNYNFGAWQFDLFLTVVF